MDSITQAALGACIGEAILGKKMGPGSAVLGAIIASIPDLDVILTLFYDPLEKISLHRGFSHSLLFTLLTSLLLAYVLSKINRTSNIRLVRLWSFVFLALLTHVLLDTFTTYGTQLFLPFSDLRVGFDSINIIDPVYTAPLLLGLFLSLFYCKNNSCRISPNLIGLVLSSMYLIFTLWNKQQVINAFENQINDNNIQAIDLLTVPVKSGNIFWYGVVKDELHLHIGKYSIIEKNDIHFESFPINDHLLDGLDAKLVDRMKWFAKGFYTVAENEGKIRIYNMQCDMQGIRYFGESIAPTAFYFEIIPQKNGAYILSSGMHRSQ